MMLFWKALWQFLTMLSVELIIQSSNSLPRCVAKRKENADPHKNLSIFIAFYS
jgi:hypothetical protein